MRTPEELNSPEFQDDMSELTDLLAKLKIPYTLKRHFGAHQKVKELLGYYPAGEWHVIIGGRYSVIRGMASFGMYEIMNIKNKKRGRFLEPERFSTPDELVNALI